MVVAGPSPNVYVSDFAAAANYYEGRLRRTRSRIGMSGFCFGGSITWRTAEAVPLKAAGQSRRWL